MAPQGHSQEQRGRRLEVLFVACCTGMFALIVGASVYLLVKLVV